MPTTRAVRILVIDDDIEAAELLKELLQVRGYEVECEACVEQVSASVERSPWDVIISDIRLGTWSGLELPALLGNSGLSNGAVCRPLLIALSGDYGERAEACSIAAGFDHHFAKPVELEQLDAAIRAKDATLIGRATAEPHTADKVFTGTVPHHIAR